MVAITKFYDFSIEDLKILPEYFDALIDGRKPFEVRKNDRNYKPGDKYRLREYAGSEYMPECMHFKEIYCSKLLEMGYTEEELDDLYSYEYIDICDKRRYYCCSYTIDKYTGRTATIQIKEVFPLPGEISDYVALTFDILEVNLEGKPRVETIIHED